MRLRKARWLIRAIFAVTPISQAVAQSDSLIYPSAATVEPGGTLILKSLTHARVVWSIQPDPEHRAIGTIARDEDPSIAIYKAPALSPNIAHDVLVTASVNGTVLGTAHLAFGPQFPPQDTCADAVANAQNVNAAVDPHIEIVLTKHPSTLITSYPINHSREVGFTARASDGTEVNIQWTIVPTGVPVGGPVDIGTIAPINGNYVTYTAPTEGASRQVCLVAQSGNAAYAKGFVRINVLPDQWIHCRPAKLGEENLPCIVGDFDRLAGDTGTFRARPADPAVPVDGATDKARVLAINAAKTISSGSLLEATLPRDKFGVGTCTNYDWKLVVQSEESAGILLYGPADVGSGICDEANHRFLIALPVHVLWADLMVYHQNLDPTRAAPAGTSNFTDCGGLPARLTIAPCDKNRSPGLTLLYKNAFLFRLLSPPGNGQGSINYSGKGTVNFDAQADPAFKWGKGWLNFPTVFERGNVNGNLNAFLFSAAYDFRWLDKPNFGDAKTRGRVIRKPQIQFRSGVEGTPSLAAAVNSVRPDRQWNFVNGELIRLPITFSFYDLPSAVTVYPVIGAEEGWHLATNIGSTDPILRGVAGADASFRLPFKVSHNFLGPTPITFEAQYRVRWLAYDEAYSNFAALPSSGTTCPPTPGMAVIAGPSGNKCVATEQGSTVPRPFFKGDMIFPLDQYIQLKATFTRGSLPPVFWNIGWTYSLGVSFGNPAGAEH